MHIKKMAKKSKFIQKQWFMSPKEKDIKKPYEKDPFLEEKNTVTKGLVHKYKNRVLILLTMECASYCRFCTRRRTVSSTDTAPLTKSDIDEIEKYLRKHKEICDVIFSGGDPLMAQENLLYAIEKFIKVPHIMVMRIDTRVPVADPKLLTDSLIKKLSNFNKKIPIYIGIHFEHPDELCKETIEAIEKLRKASFSMFSQSVFLKGINDNFETLYKLFQSLISMGVRPYYIYHCDSLVGTEKFVVPLKKEVEIMTKLRNNCSGIAYPLHIICVPTGYGKIPVPTNHWEFSLNKYQDFHCTKKKP